MAESSPWQTLVQWAQRRPAPDLSLSLRPRLLERYPRMGPAVAFGLLALSLILLINPFWHASPDSAVYLGLGQNLNRGWGYTFNGLPHAKYPPGFPILLSGLMRVSHSFLWLNAVQVFIFLLSLGCLYLIFRRFTPRATAVTLTGIAGTLFWLREYSMALLSEGLLLLFSNISVLLLLAFLDADREASRKRWLLLAGAFLAWTAAFGCRVVATFWIVPFGLALLAHARKRQHVGPALGRAAAFGVLVVVSFVVYQGWMKGRDRVLKQSDMQLAMHRIAAPTVSPNEERSPSASTTSRSPERETGHELASGGESPPASETGAQGAPEVAKPGDASRPGRTEASAPPKASQKEERPPATVEAEPARRDRSYRKLDRLTPRLMLRRLPNIANWPALALFPAWEAGARRLLPGALVTAANCGLLGVIMVGCASCLRRRHVLLAASILFLPPVALVMGYKPTVGRYILPLLPFLPLLFLLGLDRIGDFIKDRGVPAVSGRRLVWLGVLAVLVPNLAFALGDIYVQRQPAFYAVYRGGGYQELMSICRWLAREQTAPRVAVQDAKAMRAVPLLTYKNVVEIPNEVRKTTPGSQKREDALKAFARKEEIPFLVTFNYRTPWPVWHLPPRVLGQQAGDREWWRLWRYNPEDDSLQQIKVPLTAEWPRELPR